MIDENDVKFECNNCGNIMVLKHDRTIYICTNPECTSCYEEPKEKTTEQYIHEVLEKYFEQIKNSKMTNRDEPANPFISNYPRSAKEYEGYSGLTKLEYFTAMALQGLLSNPEITCSNSIIADTALIMAVETLNQLEKLKLNER